jgi:hypothetical protein
MNPIRWFSPYALAILSILVGAQEVLTHWPASEQTSPAGDMVGTWEERIEPLRQALPGDVYMVGYLDGSDIPGSTEIFDEAEAGLSQYALAPVVVRPGVEHTWIIGNFGSRVELKTLRSWLAQTLGPIAIQDFGFGLYLIHRGG